MHSWSEEQVLLSLGGVVVLLVPVSSGSGVTSIANHSMLSTLLPLVEGIIVLRSTIHIGKEPFI